MSNQHRVLPYKESPLVVQWAKDFARRRLGNGATVNDVVVELGLSDFELDHLLASFSMADVVNEVQDAYVAVPQSQYQTSWFCRSCGNAWKAVEADACPLCDYDKPINHDARYADVGEAIEGDCKRGGSFTGIAKCGNGTEWADRSFSVNRTPNDPGPRSYERDCHSPESIADRVARKWLREKQHGQFRQSLIVERKHEAVVAQDCGVSRSTVHRFLKENNPSELDRRRRKRKSKLRNLSKWGWIIDLLLKDGEALVRPFPKIKPAKFAKQLRCMLSGTRETCIYHWSVRIVRNRISVKRGELWDAPMLNGNIQNGRLPSERLP